MKIELLKKWKKKKIFSSETMWKNLITQPDDMKQSVMVFFFFFNHYKVLAYNIHLWWLCSLSSNQDIN